MKITNYPNFLPKIDRPSARSTPEGPAAFRTLLGQCQETGACPPQGPELAASTLDTLEKIAALIGSGASAREMAPAHEHLARQAERLRSAAEKLAPGPLKSIMSETAALGYLQLWRFEQGEFA